MSPRMRELLGLAAKAFDEGTNPFTHKFLEENHVNVSECLDLGSLIAAILNWYLLNS
jgi:hypothetical protein